MRRRGFTAVELVLVIVVLAIVVTVTLVVVDRIRQARLREESAANLRVLWGALLSLGHTETSRALPEVWPLHVSVVRGWPMISVTPGQLTPEPTSPHMQDLLKSENQSAFVSPAHPNVERMRKAAQAIPASAITDASYWYLGYGLPNEEVGLVLVDEYKKAVEETGKPPSDIILVVKPFDYGSGEKIDSLRSLLLTPLKGRASTPVFIERPGLQRGGSNVLFQDGHVEFIPYPGKFPMTEKFIKALESLDELKVKE